MPQDHTLVHGPGNHVRPGRHRTRQGAERRVGHDQVAVVTPQDFDDLDALTSRLLAFQDRYNTTAGPFDWFTRKSHKRLLDCLATHDAA
jgi:hypothetical protein